MSDDLGFSRAQWAYDHQMPPEAPDCGCEQADDPDHDAEACLDDQKEAAAEAKAEQQREDLQYDREDWGP